MSDIADELRAFEGSEALGNGDFSTCYRGAAEIARLRAELAAARLVPPLNPDRWRGAINDALTNWMDSILDDETPKDALRRLMKYEIIAALDPAVSQSAADLLANARRQGMEEAATRLQELHKNHKYNRKTGEGSEHDVGYYRAIAEGVAHILRAAAKEENRPSEEIIREDRDAWPDHQANDPIRAAAKEGE